MYKPVGCSKTIFTIVTVLYVCKVDRDMFIQGYVVKNQGNKLFRNTAINTRKTDYTILLPKFINHEKDFETVGKSRHVDHSYRGKANMMSKGHRRSAQLGRPRPGIPTSTVHTTTVFHRNKYNNEQTKQNKVNVIANGYERSFQLRRQTDDNPAIAKPAPAPASSVGVLDGIINSLQGVINSIIALITKYAKIVWNIIADMPEALIILYKKLQEVFGTPGEKMNAIRKALTSKYDSFMKEVAPLPEMFRAMMGRLFGIKTVSDYFRKIVRLLQSAYSWFMKEIVSKPGQIRDTVYRILRVENVNELGQNLQKQSSSIMDWLNKDVFPLPTRLQKTVHKLIGNPTENWQYLSKLFRSLSDWLMKDVVPIPQDILDALRRVFDDEWSQKVQAMLEHIRRLSGLPMKLFNATMKYIRRIIIEGKDVEGRRRSYCVGDVLRILTRMSWVQSVVGLLDNALKSVGIAMPNLHESLKDNKVYIFIRSVIFRPTPPPELNRPFFKSDTLLDSLVLPCDSKYGRALPRHPFDKKMAGLVGTFIHNIAYISKTKQRFKGGLPLGLAKMMSQQRSRNNIPGDDSSSWLEWL